MLFNPASLAAKIQHLDEVSSHGDLVRRTVAAHISRPFRLVPIPRVWNPGGGSTLFRIETAETAYFLKVKHRTVTVESRLEGEPHFSSVPSLRNEADFLSMLKEDWAPAPLFFAEASEFEFLAVEWLESFPDAARRMTPSQLVDVWQEMETAARNLFERGIVHTDIHEHNICLRGTQPVLVDFEEARFLAQELPFEASLDVVGVNKYGDVGTFPDIDGALAGRTCLCRLREVLAAHVRRSLEGWMEHCHFDRDCPYNLDEQQQPDPRVYQSLFLAGLKVEGQRPARDPRLALLTYVLRKLARSRSPLRHVDLGSNLGTFCLRAAELPFVSQTVGLDASAEFVACGRALSFVTGLAKASFLRFVAGRDDLAAAVPDADVVTAFSIYHHVADKDRLLQDLARLRPPFLLAEFATQERYYRERGSLEGEREHIARVVGFRYQTEIAVTNDYLRPVVLFTRDAPPPLNLRLTRHLTGRLGTLVEAMWVCAWPVRRLVGRPSTHRKAGIGGRT